MASEPAGLGVAPKVREALEAAKAALESITSLTGAEETARLDAIAAINSIYGRPNPE